MRIKRKGTFAVVLSALLLCVLTLFLGFSIRAGAKTVSAAGTPRYKMYFDYKYSAGATTDPSADPKMNVEAEKKNVLKSDAHIAQSVSEKCEIEFEIYGSYPDSTAGTGTLVQGGTLNSKEVTINVLNSIYDKNSFQIKKASGTVVASASTKKISATLDDGTYYVTYVGQSNWTQTGPLRNVRRVVIIECTFNFKIGGHVHSYTPTVTKPTCTAGGYTTYKCSCGYSYTDDKTSALGHDYKETQTTTCTGETTIYRCSRCGDTYSKTTGDGIGHSYTAKTTAPTCTADGYTTYTCSRCGDSYTESKAPALGHSYTAKTTSPTCTADGYTTYTCTRCGDSYTESKAPALGHSLSATRSISCTAETTVYACARCNYSTVSTGEGYGHDYVPSVTEPTCTSGGYTIFTCSNCGDSYRDNETQPLGHNYTITQNNSCTGGTTNYKCSRCGQTYSESTQGGLGHSYVASITAPTCVDRGYTVYVCSRCGDSYRDNETQALGHNYVATVVSPTCTTSGYTVYTCSRCESSYRSGETQATGHRYVSSSYPATCETGGYTLHECEICGTNYRDNETQPLGHNFITETELPTCTEFGMTVYSCQVCGYEKRESDGTYPTGHSFTNIIVNAATCTTDGMRRQVCDKCGEAVESHIPALGHHYEITSSTTSGDNTIRQYTCSVCGDSYTQELGNQYEQVTNYVEYLFEQYAPYMYWVLLATAGLWSIAIGVAIIIAVKNEDKAKAKKMLVNYVIGLVVIFAIVVACPYLMRGIAALVT